MARVMLLGLLVVVGSFLVHEIYSLDVWWQIAIGRDILARGAVPTVDRYAVAALGRPYHDSHWLFQVVLALAHRAGGMGGVQAVMVLLWATTLYLCLRAIRRWTSPVPSYALLFLVAMASVERFLPRPELVTFCMIAAFSLRLQERSPPTVRDCVMLAVLQAIWTNCHGLFVVGPFMVACYWAVSGIAAWRGTRTSGFAAYTGLLGAVLAATLLSPHGLAGWKYAVLLATEAGPNAPQAMTTVGELSPTFGAAARSQPAFWFFLSLLAGAAATTLYAAAKRGLAVPRVLIATGLGVAALTGRRNMPLFALVAAPLIAEHARVLFPAPRRHASALALPATVAMLAWAAYPLSGRYFVRAQLPARVGFGVTPSFFPHGLPGFLDRIGFRGRVFNSNTLGGFYLYHGFPDRRPLTDGRWEVYDPSELQAIREAVASPERWRRLVGRYGIEGALLQHASPEAAALLPILRSDPAWRLVYYDYAASFWLASAAPYDAAAIEPRALAQLPPRPARVDDCIMLDPFLRGLGLTALRVQNLERAFTFRAVPKHEELLGTVGMLQLSLGREPEAEDTFRAMLAQYPENLTALNELAFFAFRRGDLEKATTLLDRALAVDPDHANSRANRQRVTDAIRARHRGGAPPAPAAP